MHKQPLTRRQFKQLIAAAAATGAAELWGQPARPRLRRADSFFGLHFDLHPAEEDTALGRDVNEAMVQGLLDATKPDYVQYDSKGHAGWLGWKSEVGPSAPGIVNDSLAVWRKVTADNGVALYIHFSGVWDSEAVRRHPDWARVDAEGRIDKRQTSTFGPYVDALMIPQLREAAAKYDLDGVWVDGECWATHPDFREGAVEAFKKATGRKVSPRSQKDDGWNEFLEFNRERFRQYVRHYVTEVHRTHPQFQIASNWLYSTFVPEEPALPVDFLSGDYLGNASISTARVEARYLAQTGKPWDLMAWGFQQAESNAIGHVYKPAVQLQQEASVVLAQGGGFQVYYVPSRAGHFDESHVKVMGEVARFCRARQKNSHRSESVPQAGVVFSKETLYTTTNKLFGGWGKLMDPARGWIDALVGCQWSVDVLPDWKLSKMASSYPLIVLPDWAAPGEAVHSTLEDYVKTGGQLIVCGAANSRRWAPAIGMSAMGEAQVEETFLTGGEVLAIAKGLWQKIEPGAGSVLEWRVPDHDSRKDREPAAVSGTLGKGRVVIIPGPVGAVYAATHATTVRDFVKRVAKPMFTPLVEVIGPPTLEVSLRRKDGALLMHLLNTTGMQVAGDFASIDFIPTVGPVRLKFNGAQPKSVRMEPEGTELRAPYEVSRLEVHSIARVVF